MEQDASNVKRSPSAEADSGNSLSAPYANLYVLECLSPAGVGPEIRCKGLLGCWREPPYVYFFFNRRAGEEALAVLKAMGLHVTGTYEMAYAQWQHLPSRILDVGPFRIVFEPPVDRKRSRAQKIIFLNRGLVFGSGMHPTTQLCLHLLGRIFCPATMTTVVDLGTGTGILALAAARLGARRVMAVDLNPLAVQEAAANICRNGLGKHIFPVVAEGMSVSGRFGHLLLMNLEWPSLCAVLQGNSWKRFPYVLCSGYLQGNAPAVRERLYETHRLQADAELEGWGASFWASGA